MANFTFNQFDTDQARANARASQQAILFGLLSSIDRLQGDGKHAFHFQSALGTGALFGQDNELERLKAKHGPNHRYVLAAQARANTLHGMGQNISQMAEYVGTFVSSFTDVSVFHGYVFDTEGNVLPGMQVQLNLISPPGGISTVDTFVVPTNAEGYFHINLAIRGGNVVTHIKPAEVVADRFNGLFKVMGSVRKQATDNLGGEKFTEEYQPQPARQPASFVADTASPGATSGTSGNGSGTSGNPQFTSEVRILDANDKLLYIDPMPPQFDSRFENGQLTFKSQFRLYVLS